MKVHFNGSLSKSGWSKLVHYMNLNPKPNPIPVLNPVPNPNT